MEKQAEPGKEVLFVYGTLRRGGRHPMARLLAQRAHYRGPAQVAGRLYHLGRYPGVVQSPRPNEWVCGDLFDLGDAPGLLRRLDRYEGVVPGRKGKGEYRRQSVNVFTLTDDTPIVASIYLYVLPVNRLRRLTTGDYLRERRR
jgi:gamma-glutamylcyclotransferase (GGCT)/AIG2-like uncharacterized protein YtfP